VQFIIETAILEVRFVTVLESWLKVEFPEFLDIHLPELLELEIFLEDECGGSVATLANVELPDQKRYSKFPVRQLPIYKVSYGSEDHRKPTLILVGGVHGLERIGTQVVKALLFSFNELVQWDAQIRKALEQIRVIFIPLVNPWGMALNRRSNAMGIDLMRNAPVEATGKTFPLLSGHRIGASLPWYRGVANGPMELESSALIRDVLNEISEAEAAISLDVHSGFGFRDQLWFPYAKTLEPFGHLPEMMAIKRILDRTYPYHIYKVEPQALNYVTHGDLWDHIYDENLKINKKTYIPLCLEMGSWTWVRKNPSQLLLTGGIFDPILPHRRHRAYRRHHLLFDLLIRLLLNPGRWAAVGHQAQQNLRLHALDLWYSDRKAVR
jgi:hypothetical protein